MSKAIWLIPINFCVYFDNVTLGSQGVQDSRFARTGTVIEMLNDKRSRVKRGERGQRERGAEEFADIGNGKERQQIDFIVS